MKNTGVTRRIDELGRIVIPKEIRKNLAIREGDYLDIFIDDNTILLQKQSLIDNTNTLSKQVVDVISKIYNVDLILSDRHKITNTSNALNYFNGIELSTKLINIMDKREIYVSNTKELLSINDKEIEGYFIYVPIIFDADAIGLIILRKASPIQDQDKKISQVIKEMIINSLNIG